MDAEGDRGNTAAETGTWQQSIVNKICQDYWYNNKGFT